MSRKKDLHKTKSTACELIPSRCFEPARVVRSNYRRPAYNPSQLDGWLKLTASTFNRLWISMPTVLVTVPTVMQNYCYAELTASFINFLHHCLPSSGFYGAGKDNRGRCTKIHPIYTISAPNLPHPPHSARVKLPPLLPSVIKSNVFTQLHINASTIQSEGMMQTHYHCTYRPH